MGLKYATHMFYEQDLLCAVRELRLKGVYVDVGANIGNHTVFFSLHCPSTRVIAIEPNPAALELLKLNCASRKNVQMVACAVGARRGAVRVKPTARNNLGSSRIGDAGHIVRMSTLDLVVENQKVAFIKIDTEGYELNVLRGASNVLKSKPVLAVECSTPESLDAVQRELARYGKYSVSPRYCATPTYLFIPGKPQELYT